MAHTVRWSSSLRATTVRASSIGVRVRGGALASSSAALRSAADSDSSITTAMRL